MFLCSVCGSTDQKDDGSCVNGHRGIMTDHNYIYLQPECCADETYGRMWCQDPDPEIECEDGKHWTKYVRFDIAQSREQELEAEVAKYKRLFLAAKEFVDASPADPDINAKQTRAWLAYKEALAND